MVKIIGAGIAGSYAAFQAARKGIKVEVLEQIPQGLWKKTPLTGRMCGEGVWLRKLEAAGIKINPNKPPKFVENVITTFNLAYLTQEGQISFFSKKAEPYLLLNRKKFIDWMRQKAEKLGATFHFSTKIADINQLKDKKQKSFIIAAWGSNLAFTSQIIKKNFKIGYVLACQHTLRGVDSKKIFNGKTIVLTDDPKVRYFYIFPKGPGNREEANVGVAFNASDIQLPLKTLDKFLRSDFLGCLAQAKIVPKRTFVKKIVSSLPLTQNDLATKFVLPVGDAGCQVSAVSGGGIGYSLLGAVKAVDALISNKPLKEYYTLIEKLIEKLQKEYYLSEKLYPKNPKKKKEINREFIEITKKEMQKGKYLSLSNIAKALFN